MKTLKKFKEESREFYMERKWLVREFSQSFTKSMGGTQTIKFEDDFIEQIEVDEREYYKGRGAKYNHSSMHEHIDVLVTKEQFESLVNKRATLLYRQEKERVKRRTMAIDFCKNLGISPKNYTTMYGSSLFFEETKRKAIEEELNVDLTDFFNASGKTYFFAEAKGVLLKFYHNHRQNYSLSVVTKEQKQEFVDERDDWIKAPYAALLGQTDNPNLFVC